MLHDTNAREDSERAQETKFYVGMKKAAWPGIDELNWKHESFVIWRSILSISRWRKNWLISEVKYNLRKQSFPGWDRISILTEVYLKLGETLNQEIEKSLWNKESLF